LGTALLVSFGKSNASLMAWFVNRHMILHPNFLTQPQVLARKELNFERMSERDRKQIVAEVYVALVSRIVRSFVDFATCRNILKDLNHEHIVRYHDRHVDREAGILYILMEYCGGGDLSQVIKQAQKHNRPIPEDTIWSYFLQILLALHHCHHPNGHSRSNSSSSSECDGRERRAQIMHRDLKPDNGEHIQ
jgi:NIMA (never in mitosis gene a)-related kinase 2